MDIKLIKVLNSQEALKRLADTKLPVKTAYRVSKLVKALEKELKDFEDFRNSLIMKYGESQGGGQYKISEIDIAKFNDEINEVMETEVHLEFNSLKVNDLAEIDISATDMIVLDYLFEETNE